MIERGSRVFKKRGDIVCVFTNREGLVRLAGVALAVLNDRWAVTRRYLSLVPPTTLVTMSKPP